MCEGFKVMTVARRKSELRFALSVFAFAVALGCGFECSHAQQLAARTDQLKQSNSSKIRPGTSVAAASPNAVTPRPDARQVRTVASKGPYYVDFRARTAASYGHAFVWYGKTADKEVEVAGLHPRGDMVPYLLGHLIFVPAETGASYGDLDEQYLTARYRVYLSEADAQKVFAYIKHLQSTSPVWNVETIDCVYFIGRIASFMGLKTPSHFLKKPEAYVNELRALNGGRKTVQLDSSQEF
jgi:hypothetical protein